MSEAPLPLISVVVLSYNSAQYICSTLESIYRQDYEGPMELIIGDDCSKDNSVELCQEWIARHAGRFTRAEILCPAENQGVARNVDTCYRACKGEWVKGIAGDDILMDDAIRSCYEEAVRANASFIATAVRTFAEDEQMKTPENCPIMTGKPVEGDVDLDYVYKNPRFWCCAPGFFLSHAMLRDIDYVPQLLRNVEDRPLMARVLAHGYKIHVMKRPTVFYRVHSESITASESGARFAGYSWLIHRQMMRPCYDWFRGTDMDLKLLPHFFHASIGETNWKYTLCKKGTQFIRLLFRLLVLPWRAVFVRRKNYRH